MIAQSFAFPQIFKNVCFNFWNFLSPFSGSILRPEILRTVERGEDLRLQKCDGWFQVPNNSNFPWAEQTSFYIRHSYGKNEFSGSIGSGLVVKGGQGDNQLWLVIAQTVNTRLSAQNIHLFAEKYSTRNFCFDWC